MDHCDSQDQLQSDSKIKVEMLNDFFSSVFTREDVATVPELEVLTDEKLTDVDITVNDIYSRLCRLKSDKAAGDDGMMPHILKALGEEIALPITMICRRSLDSSSVPGDWKTADVSPIYKKGSKHHVGNYCPVSLTSQIC